MKIITSRFPLLINKLKFRNMVVFTLTLIRHGETDHNKEDVIQVISILPQQMTSLRNMKIESSCKNVVAYFKGQLDVPLSPTGFCQAELLGTYLQHQQYSHIYVSDLTRAMQTAECIIKQNKSFNEPVLKDQRLRERKFGNIEGKSFEFLKEAACKSNKKIGQFTPPGGETIQQVHDRAVSFFQDLCQMVKEKSHATESQNDLMKISSNGLDDYDSAGVVGQKRKRISDNGQEPSPESCPSRCGIKMPHPGVEKYEDCMPRSQSCSKDERSVSDASSPGGYGKESSDRDQNIEIMNNSKIENSNNKAQMSALFSDDCIASKSRHSGNNLPNIECPNVSLSPLMDRSFISSSSLPSAIHNLGGKSDLPIERRLSVCSSGDDIDCCPTLAANVLVVSHGGLLRELMRHFVEDLECTLPGGKKQALCISPNAGLSKFTVSVEPNGQAKIICLQIHDKQHLTPNLYKDRLLTIEDTAF